MVEHRPCNPVVMGSIPIAGSRHAGAPPAGALSMCGPVAGNRTREGGTCPLARAGRSAARRAAVERRPQGGAAIPIAGSRYAGAPPAGALFMCAPVGTATRRPHFRHQRAPGCRKRRMRAALPTPHAPSPSARREGFVSWIRPAPGVTLTTVSQRRIFSSACGEQGPQVLENGMGMWHSGNCGGL